MYSSEPADRPYYYISNGEVPAYEPASCPNYEASQILVLRVCDYGISELRVATYSSAVICAAGCFVSCILTDLDFWCLGGMSVDQS